MPEPEKAQDRPKVRHVYRDAASGRFCTREYAECNRSTTVRETVAPPPASDGA